MMRVAVCLLAVGLMGCGCAWFGHKKPDAAGQSGGSSSTNVIVAPDSASTGRVVRVNDSARFVVVNYPKGALPAMGQRLYVYRQGLRVGELKVTPPQDNDNVVADIVVGEAQNGDEVRTQ